MRRVGSIILLEVYAIALALFQYGIGVHTDEAKYLLNIPYPHPPLARAILGATELLSFQELFWRIVFATLLVQSVWFFLSLAKERSNIVRSAVAISWLLSAAVLYQSGSVMMAPLTAVQCAFFVWLFLRDRDNTSLLWIIGLAWLASLFTAYQAVLFGPLVLHTVWRTRSSTWQKLFIVGVPVALVCLYTLTNPLALASMLNVAGKDAAETIGVRVYESLMVLSLGGSIVLSIIGILGLLMRPRFGLLASFILVSFYVLLGRFDYYAILFTPLLMGGFLLLKDRPWVPYIQLVGMPLGLLCMLLVRPLDTTDLTYVQRVLSSLELHPTQEGALGMVGSFGHQWQYASPIPVERYTQKNLHSYQAILCLQECSELQEETGFKKRSLEGVAIIRSTF